MMSGNVSPHSAVIDNLLVIIDDPEMDDEATGNGLSWYSKYNITLRRTMTPERYVVLYDKTDGEFFSVLEDVGRYRPITVIKIIAEHYQITKKYIDLSDTDLLTLKLIHG